MIAHIVIGCGYGDEGKGITTDFLCSKLERSIVVRFSGGPQAAHTVMSGDKKHIHSNFGSGTLRGIPTYFSRHTCIYPVTIARELSVLKEKGVSPRLWIDPLAKVITPFDVMYSRTSKKSLDNGTCGLGIGKTMERNQGPLKMFVHDLFHLPTFYAKLEQIYLLYINESQIFSSELMAELREFKGLVENLKDNPLFEMKPLSYVKPFENIIFEGSQGILLDMDHGIYPHVTYANTTSKNAHELCNELGVNSRRLYYVTRSYHTRHGNGPFLEGDIELENTEHETCVPNEFQGELRAAPLDYALLNHSLSIDNIYSEGFRKTLMVTCLDQYPNFDYSRVEGSFINYLESRSPLTENIKSTLVL